MQNQLFWQHNLIYQYNQNIHRMSSRSVKGHETKLDEKSLLERPWREQGLLHFPNGSFLQQTLSAWVELQSPLTAHGTRSELRPGSTQHKQQSSFNMRRSALCTESLLSWAWLPFRHQLPCHSCWASAPSRCGRRGSSTVARFPSHHPGQRRCRLGPAQSAGLLHTPTRRPDTSDDSTEKAHEIQL